MRILAAVALAAFGMTGCGDLNKDYRNLIQPKEEVRAFDDIRASFLVAPSKVGGAAAVSIKKSALEKEFLLQPNSISQEMIPMWNGLQSRVVVFKQKSNKLYMMQANDGHVVSDEIPQNLLLTEFNITKETPDMVEFDFAEGMARIMVSADWKASDFEGGFYNLNWNAAKVRTSFLESATIENSTHMVLTQIAQTESEGFDGASLMPVTIKYYLSPYAPDPKFTPTESKSFEKMGFFEVAPRFTKDGSTKVFASKFDHSKPIEFSVSSNTPDDYKAAVKDGVLYWNKAYGKEIVKVKDAPKGLAGPDFNHNMVQWVTWDEAGFAYADAQMDPRSGQILHAQVYMTSVFAVAGRSRARSVLRKLKSNVLSAKKFQLSQFGTARSCEFSFDKKFITSLEKLLATDASDEAILRASQDYVREVIAHEIGHTLGLRHNFAGSLAANFAMSERDSIFKKYIEKKEVAKDLVTSSSVMEYQLYEEGVLTGAKIREGHDSLEYDLKAIQYLYEGKEFSKSELPAFCTDTKQGSYTDCLVFDSGRSPVEWAFYQKKSELDSLAASIAEQFIANKTPIGMEPKTVAATDLSPNSLAARLAMPVMVAQSFQKDSSFISIRRNYPAVTELNLEQIRAAELAFVTEGFAGNGGVSELTKPLAEDFATQLASQFDTLIRKDSYRNGIGYNGKPYSFDDNEIELMVSMVKQASPVIKRKYDVMVATMIAAAQSSTYEDHQLGTDMADALYVLTKRMLFAKADKKSLVVEVELPILKKEKAEEEDEDEAAAKKKEKVKLTLPSFEYTYQERLVAISLLAPKHGEAMEWNIFNIKRLKVAYSALLKEALAGREIGSISPEELSPEAARWVMENKLVWGALSGASEATK